MFALLLIAIPVLEVLAFVAVGLALGWLPAVVLLIGTSVAGVLVMRTQGRRAIERVGVAISERRAPGRAALDAALGFIGAALLVVPGFITDLLGVALLLSPTRSLARRWISRRYAGRVVGFAANAGRFARGPRGPRATPAADVDSTAYDEDLDQLGR